MEEQIQMLIAVSGQSYERCRKVLSDALYDVETAAVILLGDPGDLEIKDYDLEDENETDHKGSDRKHGNDEDEVTQICHPSSSSSSRRSRQQQQNQQQAAVADITEVINLSENKLSSNKEAESLSLDPSHNLLLIPSHRLEDLFEKIPIPPTIDFKQIWRAEGMIPIPGGITICEISSSSSSTLSCHESQVEIETFLSKLATFLFRYKMSTCYNIESITKQQSRLEFIQKMKTIFSDILEVNSKRIHQEFHEHVIFHCSIVYDDTNLGREGEDVAGSHMSHVLTVTLTGLPELLLVMQDASQAIAASMSSSSANGSTLACVPNEWSLLCHTAPYALILLEENSPEWNLVLENGRCDIILSLCLNFVSLQVV